jgi:hypothetical protein
MTIHGVRVIDMVVKIVDIPNIKMMELVVNTSRGIGMPDPEQNIKRWYPPMSKQKNNTVAFFILMLYILLFSKIS